MTKHICVQNHREWHDWFAWYPVTYNYGFSSDNTKICHEKAFWETIQRKLHYGYGDTWWEYRSKEV